MTPPDNYVKIRLRFKPVEGGIGGENPWATPVSATQAGGTYTVENDLLFTPMRHGDVVRCELDVNSILQVVEVVSLVEGNLYTLQHPTEDQDEVKATIGALEVWGFDVNRPADGWVHVMVPESELVPPTAFFNGTLPDGWELRAHLTQAQRAAYIAEDVDLTLDTTPLEPEEPVDYWAPEDPAWEELGVVEPDALARLQSLAASDPRVLATIKAGRHHDVLTYAQRLTIADPRDLPPLDRPLLVEPSE